MRPRLTKPSLLLTIPYEVRLLIYKHLFDTTITFRPIEWIADVKSYYILAILQTCHFIRSECLPVALRLIPMRRIPALPFPADDYMTRIRLGWNGSRFKAAALSQLEGLPAHFTHLRSLLLQYKLLHLFTGINQPEDLARIGAALPGLEVLVLMPCLGNQFYLAAKLFASLPRLRRVAERTPLEVITETQEVMITQWDNLALGQEGFFYYGKVRLRKITADVICLDLRVSRESDRESCVRHAHYIQCDQDKIPEMVGKSLINTCSKKMS